ncbi:MAG: DNA integrity scanning diadenylate cyclase DisA [Acidimicrobiia bacterium]|nr:DNA integrity scanning diadenylate cyclase DisA [Acidimicrobiia bacterium]
MLSALATTAPGQPLREGLDRIREADLGALLVIGDDPAVLAICSGGFLLDASFSPQRLSELAKMDGAIILANDASRIARANVQLMPDPSVPTAETGTRHRTAERVARSLGVAVISVSESRDAITVYLDAEQRPLLSSSVLLARANQALQTLEQYRKRLDHASSELAALEVEDLVTVRDVVSLVQRLEMVRRISDEIEVTIVELGTDGRLVRLQLEELLGGADDERRLVLRDYVVSGHEWDLAAALGALDTLETEELLDARTVASALHLVGPADDLDASVTARGYRLLTRVPRLPDLLIDRVVERFGTLQKIMRATPAELAEVAGLNEARGRSIKDALGRLAESSILDHYS